jgi:hypothetical protein
MNTPSPASVALYATPLPIALHPAVSADASSPLSAVGSSPSPSPPLHPHASASEPITAARASRLVLINQRAAASPVRSPGLAGPRQIPR